MQHTIQLSDHFNYGRLLRFTVPAMVMMIFTSIYSVVDGIFVSNFVGKTAFAAVNLIFPFLMLLGVVGSMLGTGGSALVAKTLGQRDRELANRIFSRLVVAGVVVGVVFCSIGFWLIEDIAVLLGARGDMVQLCVTYGRIILPALPCFILQYMFQSLLITAERPTLGLAVTVIAGLTNIVLDFLLIVVFDLGLVGAACATALAQTVGGLVPLVYFALPNTSLLRLVKPVYEGRFLVQAATNGLSEFLSSVSMSVVSMLYNWQLMRYIGEDGVAAYGVIMYVAFILMAMAFGYSMGVSPIVSYNYGSGNHAELQNVFRRSLVLVAIMGAVTVVLAECLATPLSQLFVGYDEGLFALTRKAFMIYCLSFFLAGFNMFASAFFTALNNGIVSGVIAFGRTMVCETTAVLVLPLLFGMDGIWFAIIVAEVLALMLSASLLLRYRRLYHYWE
ncbi:MAG: MATE family efflux transporter [Bacteroidaceae bacterium]|nr:MATE family efflux transporter [Bacteroidaceae bacterium]